MIAKELINQMIPSLSLNDDIPQVMSILEELRVKELPVTEKGQFKGFISQSMISEDWISDRTVKDFVLIGSESKVHENQHFYDIIKLNSEQNVNSVAVLDDEENFLGVITVEDTINALSQSVSVQHSGGILVISLKMIDYSMAEISRLIEEDNVKILSSSIQSDPRDPDQIKLTLKLNKLELTAVVKTLERFGYRIIARFHEESNSAFDEQERIDHLFKYLGI